LILCNQALFDMLCDMKLNINNRGNGACPLCLFADNCVIHQKLRSAVDTAEKVFHGNPDDEMQLVIYSCPYFKER